MSTIQERLREPWTQSQSRRVALEQEAANVIDGLVEALRLTRPYVASERDSMHSETYQEAQDDLEEIDTALASTKYEDKS